MKLKTDRHRSTIVNTFFVLAIALIVIIRFTGLDIRPLHHDEGVNFFFLEQTSQNGFYHYSHENYHGSTFFYLTWLGWQLIGTSEFGLRFVVGLLGAITVALIPLWWRKEFHWKYTGYVASLLLALSPVHTYFSRYAIHEVLFIGLTTLLAFSLERWLRKPKIKYELIGGAALGLLIATKETYVIAVYCLGMAALISSPLKLLGNVFTRYFGMFVGIFLAFFLAIAIITAGFTWMDGVGEMILSVPQWITRNSNDTGHFKPWYYYLEIFYTTERGALVLSLASLFILPEIFLQKEFSRGRFLWGWGLSSLIVYSCLSYKMPWLFVNIAVPLILAGTETISYIKSSFIRILVIIVAVFYSVTGSFKVNFVHPQGDMRNPFAYVHTLPGELELVKDIKGYLERRGSTKGREPIRILIGIDGYWPLPFYLRKLEEQGFVFALAYESLDSALSAGKQPFIDNDIVIAEARYPAGTDPILVAKDHPEDYLNQKEKNKKRGSKIKWIESYYRLAEHEDARVFYKVE